MPKTKKKKTSIDSDFQGFSERQAGHFEFKQGIVSNRLQDFLKTLGDDSSDKWKMLCGILTIACLILSILLARGEGFEATISSSPNSTVIGTARDVSINQSVRTWNQLTPDEQEDIIAEIRRRFPQVNEIGKGVKWREITQWMVQEKRVIHNNPRDLFRGNRPYYRG